MARKGDGLYLRGKVWYLDFRHEGVRHVFKIGKGISRSVAGEIATTKRTQVLRGEAGIGGKRRDSSFEDARKKFETWLTTEKRPNTVRRYKQSLKQLARAFGDKRLSQITVWAIEHYKKERLAGRLLTERPAGLSDAEWSRLRRQAERGAPIGVNRDLATLKCLFNRCAAWGIFDGANPVRAVKLRKEPRTRLRWLSPEVSAVIQ